LSDPEVLGSCGVVLVPARDSSRSLPATMLCRLHSCKTRVFTLRCDFDEGGPWAGTKDLFRDLLPDLKSNGADLLRRHDYELVHVLPELKTALGIQNPCLTDLASNEERVRNFPADRALRIVHGLIDLLGALRERLGRPEQEEWILLCVDYDLSSSMTSIFLSELVRRAGSTLLLIALPSGDNDSLSATASRVLPFRVYVPGAAQPCGEDKALETARALEAQVDEDILASTSKIPELIRLWKIAGSQRKVFEWQYRALSAFNTLGFYVDAIRYGEAARDYYKKSVDPHAKGAHALRWGILFKLFMSYLGINSPEAAQRLVEEDAPCECEDTSDEAAMRARLCYLLAMLHARYLPNRDLSLAEDYLERGLIHLDRAELAANQRYFLKAFNRNGLAMIRSFQKRHQEALSLCQEARRLLDEHLETTAHRLHRSVLIYNMAQVFAQMELFDLAIEYYSAAMMADPNYSEYYNERANILLKLGRLDEADGDYRRAIDLGPPYFEVWSNLGQCCRLRGRMEEAMVAYDRSLDLQPNQPTVWLVRAQAAEALGRLEEAIESYGKALSLRPALWPALAGRAVLYYEQGKLVECLVDLDEAITLAPDAYEAYQNRAIVLADFGFYREASCDLQQYLRLRPDAADRAEVEAQLLRIASMSV
jgi:tetratricopeptide (TPR) repeat protein